VSEMFAKLSILYRTFLYSAYEDWKREVWEKDLDQAYCCDGSMCLCRGSSVREVYTYRRVQEDKSDE